MNCLRFFVALLCTFFVGYPIFAQPSAHPDDKVSLKYFNMHIHNSTSVPWPVTPFHSWRLWDAQVQWSMLEVAQDQWDFKKLDHYLELAKQNNVNICYVLGQTPTWASSRPDYSSSYGWGAAFPPTDIEDWRDYVRTIATRYKGQISCYEIWNEPNLTAYYAGTPQELVELAREAYPILKEIDPEIILVGPGVVREVGIPWLDDYFEAGGGSFLDVVAMHSYANPPETILSVIVDDVKDLMLQYSIKDKPLWLTEQGGGSGKVFADDGVAYVARSHFINWDAGIRSYYWYAWDNDWWVTILMVDAEDKSTLTDAAQSYMATQKWMIGSRIEPCSIDDSKTWTCRVFREDGFRGIVVWNPDKTLNFEVKKEDGYQLLEDLYGGTLNLNPGVYSIGPSPLFYYSTKFAAITSPHPTVSVAQGAAANYSLSLNRTNVTEKITLSAQGLPSGVKAVFGPTVVTGSTATLTFYTDGSTPIGTHTLQINGSVPEGYRIAPLTVTLVVNPPPNLTDITNKVQITASGFVQTSRLRQQVTLNNRSGLTWSGPMSLVLDELTPGVRITGKNLGVSNQSLVLIPALSSGVYLRASDPSPVLTLEFDNPTPNLISYTPRLLDQDLLAVEANIVKSGVVSVTRSVQQLTLTNPTSQILKGPLFVGIEGLATGVKLVNTIGQSPTGIPLVPLSTQDLAGGASQTIALEFENPTPNPLSYTTKLFASSTFMTSAPATPVQVRTVKMKKTQVKTQYSQQRSSQQLKVRFPSQP